MATTTQLLDLAVPQRTSTFRFDLLDKSLARIGTIQPDSDSPPTIGLDNTRPILRKLDNLILHPAELAQINPVSDRLQVQMVLENGAVLPLGVFLFVDASYALTTAGEEFNGSMLDLGFILDQKTEETYGLSAGADIDTALQSLFIQAGITKFTIEPSGQIIGSPIAWPADASRLVIMSELCALRAAYPVYFDATGYGRVRTVPVIQDVIPDVTYKKGGNIYQGTIVRKANYLASPDRYKVTDTAPNDAPITGVYNLPDTAPNSFFNRGFHITANINEQGLVNTAAAVERARVAAAQDANNYQIMTFSGAPDPRHDAFAVIDFLELRYREQSWTMPCLEGSEMSHTLAQVFS